MFVDRFDRHPELALVLSEQSPAYSRESKGDSPYSCSAWFDSAHHDDSCVRAEYIQPLQNYRLFQFNLNRLGFLASHSTTIGLATNIEL